MSSVEAQLTAMQRVVELSRLEPGGWLEWRRGIHFAGPGDRRHRLQPALPGCRCLRRGDGGAADAGGRWQAQEPVGDCPPRQPLRTERQRWQALAQ